MTSTVLEDWISLQPNLKQQCEKILNKRISARCWYDWESLVGAIYEHGQKIVKRVYTDEQAQLFLCLAWLRKHHPSRHITYRTLRDYWQSNEYKIEEAMDYVCSYPAQEQPSQPKLIPLSEVKQCCDEILGRKLSRECVAKWKQHLGIFKYSRTVDEGRAGIMVYMACWRHDHPNKRFPSIKRLLLMMNDRALKHLSLETNSSIKLQHKWEMSGCIGKDLPKYLAAHGYRVALSTLYRWGNFQSKRHYSVAELHNWKRLAQEKKYGS